MRRKIIDSLYVGTVEDCRAVGPEWSVVHACKSPCHMAECGTVKPGAKHYLHKQRNCHLFLNMIDAPTPMFPRELFEQHLIFMQQQWEMGRKVLIHCNQGESRAPTLALLFMAKCLHKLSNESFDAAWDDFDRMIAPDDQYRPSTGLEGWMREHWDSFAVVGQYPALEGAAPDLSPMGESFPDGEDGDEDLVLTSPLYHFAGFTQIEAKDHRWIEPTPNVLQFRCSEAYEWCMAEGVAGRFLTLKPRQVGCSTIWAEICYHHLRCNPSDMLVMGDVAKRTEKVYGMFNDFSMHDSYKWDSTYEFNTEKGIFTYADGTPGLVEHDTALDPKAGISSTRQVVWLTEAARYMKAGGRDKKVLLAIMGSIPELPRTLVTAESTAEGCNGFFYEAWQGAVTLEQRRKGVRGNGWIKIFAAWFEFPEYSLARTQDNADYFKEELDDRERRGINLYRWSAGQIAWRRMKLKMDCSGDARVFDQDYPEDAESAFLSSGRPRFDMQAVSAMEKDAMLRHDMAPVGSLEQNETGEIQFLERTDGEAWLWVAEKPAYGFSYIGFLDPCTGAQGEGSPFPDAHAAGILRAPYLDKGVLHHTRLAAVIDVPTGCRWDDEVLAERLERLLRWYGGCMIVPETGNGLGAMAELRRAGALIYEREKMDAMYPGKMLKIAGWHTTGDTRPLIINAMANVIRERTLDCSYRPAISEMKTFVINDRGKAEAKSGRHDDWIMGIGIGLACIDRAMVMTPPRSLFGHSSRDVLELAGGLDTRALS